MIAFELARGHDAAVLFIEALALVTNAVSLVGVDTLAQHPASFTHPPIALRLAPVAGSCDSQSFWGMSTTFPLIFISL